MSESKSYQSTVMDHFMNPRNAGDLEGANGIGEVGAAACGDVMRISLRIKDGKIEEAKFRTFGCGTAIAASSITTVLVKGLTVEQAASLTSRDIAEALGGLPPSKVHCPVLAEEALRSALKDYQRRQPGASRL